MRQYRGSTVCPPPHDCYSLSWTPASRTTVLSMFDDLEGELERCGFFPPGKKPAMTANLRDILHRLDMTEQEERTLRGVFKSLAEGPKAGREPKA